MELVCSSHCFARCVARSDEIASTIFVDDITASTEGGNKGLTGKFRKGFEVNKEVEEKGLILSITGG